MILWGKIRDFSIFSILQFLASDEKTGVLEIQDFEEYGYVYMTRGRVDAISLPLSDDLLGSRLVSTGALSEGGLKECMLTYSEEENQGPLGVLLLNRARADTETLRDIVNGHTQDQALQLSNWTSGTFKFVLPQRQVRFPITPSIDVQSLLLEASRRLDEGERPRKAKLGVEEEICATCTIECSDEIKERFLRSDMCLWRSMPSVQKDHAFKNMKRGRHGDGAREEDDLPFL